MNYYNEIDPYAAQWLRNLIDAGHLPAGDVDTRSIVDVRPDDLAGYAQCHFFAGIGGWALAARLAGWPDDRPLWTGSCPCQPFSVAGKQSGTADERHLWPDFFRLIRGRRPPLIMGDQVAAAVGKDWLDGVFDDLEGVGYSCEAAIAPACAVNAPHRRDRLWFVAGSKVLADMRGIGSAARISGSKQGQERTAGIIDDSGCEGSSLANDSGGGRQQGSSAAAPARHRRVAAAEGGAGFWHDAAWIIGHDGKARRAGTRVRRVVDGISTALVGMCAGEDSEETEVIPMLAHDVQSRTGKLRALGNAIVPAEAAEVIAAWMECAA